MLLPVAFSLAAAVAWGFTAHIQRIALDDTDVHTGSFLTVATIAVACWLCAPFLVDPAWWSTQATLVFAIMGVFFPALGQRFQIAAVGLVGASLTTSLAALTPVVAVAVGYVVLQETLNTQGAIGLVLMVAGLALAAWSPKGIKRGFPLWVLAVPLGAAVVRGISQPGLKFGMQEVPSPFFALLITSTVSTIVLGLLYWRQRARGQTRAGRGVWWFSLNGLFNGAGIMFLNLALQSGAIALVSPLAATTPLWALLFGALLFRRETLGMKHLIIAVLIVAGGALIVTR